MLLKHFSKQSTATTKEVNAYGFAMIARFLTEVPADKSF
jgi:hypothetical protein